MNVKMRELLTFLDGHVTLDIEEKRIALEDIDKETFDEELVSEDHEEYVEETSDLRN